MRRILALVIVLIGPLAACAQSTKTIALPPDHSSYATLKPASGLGYEVAERSCRSCHSADYIVMQPRGGAKQWDAVVTKMIKVFGANLSAEETKAVVEYLSSAYGQ